MENALLDRTVAADRAAARARRRRQQRRQHQHHRLQGRRLGVRGIPVPTARADAFPARPARQLRAGPRHLARHEPGPDRAHRQSARRRHRRQRLLRRADRRAASATPATARCRSTPPASSSPTKAIAVLGDGGPIVFSRTTATSRSATTARSRAARAPTRPARMRGKLRLVDFDNPQQLQKDGSSTFAAPNGVTPQPVAATRASCRARSRNRTSAASSR